MVSTPLVEKTLTVLSIAPTTELATGDQISQVTFGQNIDVTNEVISRIPPNARETFFAKTIGVNEFVLFIKSEEVPYRVGSKWKLTIKTNGTIGLVESK
jgi:hypothetical protein